MKSQALTSTSVPLFGLFNPSPAHKLSFFERARCKLLGRFRELSDAAVVTNDGVKLIVDRKALGDPEIIRAILFDRHERTEAALVKYVVRPTDRVLELGSGLGFITMLCARMCGAENIVTVEGNPRMHALLKQNLALNGYDIDARQAVVSLDGGPMSFQISNSLVSSSLYERGNSSAQLVESLSFRELLAEIRPNVLIMDIEGSEIDLLGAADLDGVRAIGVETHPQIVGEDAVDAMEKRLFATGFQLDPNFASESTRRLYVCDN